MTTPCEHFENMIMDLAYGELPDDTASGLHDHIKTCTTCAGKYNDILQIRDLAAQIELPELDSQFDSQILNMAKQQIKDAKEDTDNPVQASNIITFAKKLRKTATKPQIATITLVAAGILFTVISIKESPQQQMLTPLKDQAIEINHQPETILSTAKTVKQTDTLKEKQSSAKYPESNYKSKLSPTDTKPSRIQKDVTTSRSRSAKKTKAAPKQSAPSKRLSGGSSFSQPPSSKRTMAGQASKQKTSSNNTLGEMSASSRSTGAPSPSFSSSVEAPSLNADEAPSRESDSVTNQNNYTTDSFKEGLNFFNSGNCRKAVDSFSTALQSGTLNSNKTADALNYIGQCHQRTGRCANAVISYNKIINRYHSYAKRPEVMWKAAACYRKLGQLNNALTVLKSLQNISGWRIKAQNEIDKINNH